VIAYDNRNTHEASVDLDRFVNRLRMRKDDAREYCYRRRDQPSFHISFGQERC